MIRPDRSKLKDYQQGTSIVRFGDHAKDEEKENAPSRIRNAPWENVMSGNRNGKPIAGGDINSLLDVKGLPRERPWLLPSVSLQKGP